MNSKFVGVTKEIIESEVGQPAKVAVEFAVNTDDVATAKLFLDKINDFKDRINELMEYNKIPESSRRGARYVAELDGK